MSEAEQDWSDWVSKLAAGDESTAADFWKQYGPRLQQLAGKHLAVGMQRRVDADDVVQSACRTFLRRVQGDEFALADSESLWRLMCAITMTKLKGHIRFHTRQKRAVDRERHFESGAGEGFAAGRRIESKRNGCRTHIGNWLAVSRCLRMGKRTAAGKTGHADWHLHIQHRCGGFVGDVRNDRRDEWSYALARSRIARLDRCDDALGNSRAITQVFR